MRKSHYYALLILILSNSSLAAVNTDECEAQFRNVLKPDVNCLIQITPDAETLATFKTAMQGLVQDFKCSVPLEFPKSDIYNHWITSSQIKFPPLKLSCDITGIDNNAIPATSEFSPHCKESDSTWSCEINMSNTTGLGFLGRGLENYVNTNEAFKQGLADALVELSQ
tara:strand:- start:6358 stop:6861 length:504 start_codon:yes stop_codon:yes gene_type:complete